MQLDSLEFQIFLGLVVVLGAAFVALLCDFLKGNNEQLRERNIELRIRQDERAKLGSFQNPLQWVQAIASALRAPAPAEAVAAVTPGPGHAREAAVRETVAREAVAHEAASFVGLRRPEAETTAAEAGEGSPVRRKMYDEMKVRTQQSGSWASKEEMEALAERAARIRARHESQRSGADRLSDDRPSADRLSDDRLSEEAGASVAAKLAAKLAAKPVAKEPVPVVPTSPEHEPTREIARATPPPDPAGANPPENGNSSRLHAISLPDRPGVVELTVPEPQDLLKQDLVMQDLATLTESEPRTSEPDTWISFEATGGGWQTPPQAALPGADGQLAEQAAGNEARPAFVLLDAAQPVAEYEGPVGEVVRLKVLPIDISTADRDRDRESSDLEQLATTFTERLSMQDVEVEEPRSTQIPPGFHDSAAMRELLEKNLRFSGVVVAIGINDYASLKEKLAGNTGTDSLAALSRMIQSMLRPQDFACQFVDDEFILLYPDESGSSAQRRLFQVSEKLWDFQLRSLGHLSVMFSWGGLEVQSESLEEAVASARERMYQTRRTRKPSMNDAGSRKRVATG